MERASRSTAGDEMHVDDAERPQRAGGARRPAEIDVLPLARRIGDIAERQDGVVDHAQLVQLGISSRRIARAVAAGLLTPKHRGVYAFGHRNLTQRGCAVAALRAVGDDGVFSRVTAGALWRISPWLGEIHVTVPRRPPRSRPGLRGHSVAAWHPGDVTRAAGLPVTSPLRTLLDLAACEPLDAFERALNEAQVLGLLRGDAALERLRERSRGRRGAATIDAALDGGAAPTRSELERALLHIVDAAGVSRPHTNVRVHGVEVGALWPELRVIVECDGWGAPGHRAAFERDRARDARLAALGHVVLRFTWRPLTRRPVLVAARLSAVLSPPAPGPGCG
jgi:very-short-patch-repair endonuclease